MEEQKKRNNECVQYCRKAFVLLNPWKQMNEWNAHESNDLNSMAVFLGLLSDILSKHRQYLIDS